MTLRKYVSLRNDARRLLSPTKRSVSIVVTMERSLRSHFRRPSPCKRPRILRTRLPRQPLTIRATRPPNSRREDRYGRTRPHLRLWCLLPCCTSVCAALTYRLPPTPTTPGSWQLRCKRHLPKRRAGSERLYPLARLWAKYTRFKEYRRQSKARLGITANP